MDGVKHHPSASEHGLAVSDRLQHIRSQVEYYLSDKNLQRDDFFRSLVLGDPEGWIAAAAVLGCPRLQALGPDLQELAQAMASSESVELLGERLRRKAAFRFSAGNRSAKAASKVKGKGKTSAGKDRPGQGKGREGPEYHPATPCGYHLAGHCRHGARCERCHSVDYALAIREEWLNAGEPGPQRRLRDLAAEVLGADVALELFPRVYSQRLSLEAERARQRRGVPEDEPWQWPGGLRYLLVLDLEGKDEIIEFPVIVIDAHEGRELGRFQRFVRPVHLFDGLQLSSDSPAVPFTQVLADFEVFLQETIGRGLGSLGSDAAVLTCGDWDCRHIGTQCRISGAPLPAAFRSWVNIKRSYEEAYGGDFRGMRSMLAKLGLLDHRGQLKHGFHHLGMHDVENICRCALALLKDGHAIHINGPIR